MTTIWLKLDAVQTIEKSRNVAFFEVQPSATSLFVCFATRPGRCLHYKVRKRAAAQDRGRGTPERRQ